jgi:hypothetical protein|eukprot:COSAG01_NODE_780_length_13660_cov_171.194233_6_plen_33_part_00
MQMTATDEAKGSALRGVVKVIPQTYSGIGSYL